MSMASMVQIFSPNELRDQYNFEGYNTSNSAALFSSQFSFNSNAPPSFLPCNDHKLNVGVWEEANKGSPPMEGPFTPVHLTSSAPCSTQQAGQDDHSSYMQEAIRLRNINADLLLFNYNQIPATFEMDFPLAEDSQLNDLIGLQRKLSMYSSSAYGDEDDLSQASMAAADDQNESLMQGCSYGDGVKLCNLTRSFTFPPTAAARVGAASSSCGAARSPLMLQAGSDAEMKHGNNHCRQFHNMVCSDNSPLQATTSCSHGDDDEHKVKDVRLKTEASEISHCTLGSQDQQGVTQPKIIALSPRGFKQSKKRSANMSNSSTSGKAARLDTPSDVVHVRARRGQATDSHSLAERVRREKISQRMKVLQEIVPGCHKVLGKAMMLDEIINYVKSLQKQVEFLSLKLAAANQAGMASMITSEMSFLISNMEFLGDVNSSCHLIKSEPLMQ